MDLPRLGHAIIVNNIQGEVAGSASDVHALQRAYETVGFGHPGSHWLQF